MQAENFRHDRPPSSRLAFLMCGPSGVGKSTAARLISEITGGHLISADAMRQQAAQSMGCWHAPYSRHVTEETYRRMMFEASADLKSEPRRGVILDGTFLTARLRALAQELGRKNDIKLALIVLGIGPAVLSARLAGRDSVPGRAFERIQIAERHRELFEPPMPNEADYLLHLMNDGTLSALSAKIRAWIETEFGAEVLRFGCSPSNRE